jgi:hypothetical protein
MPTKPTASPLQKLARVGGQMFAMKNVVDAARDLNDAVTEFGGFKHIDRCPREFKKLQDALDVLDDASARDD